MKVSTRIAAGYISLLILGAAIAGAGLFGTYKIHRNLDQVVNDALPLINAAVEMESTMLKAQSTLMNFHEQEKLDQLDPIEAKYLELKKQNEKASKDIEALALDDTQLSDELGSLEKARSNLFISGDAVILAHREAVNKHLVVVEKTRMLKDMGDEIVGAASDLKSPQAVHMASKIDDVINRTLAGIELKVKGGVLSKRKAIQADFTTLDNSMQDMRRSGIGKTEKFKHVEESYQKLKDAAIGANGIYDARASEIDANKRDQENLDAVAQAGQVISINMDKFNRLINVRSSSLNVNAKATVHSSQAIIVGFALCALALALVMAYKIVQSIRAPLDTIVRGVKQLAAGDLTTNFETSGNDELAQLGQQMQLLSNNIRAIVSEINEGCIQLAATAEQTATISDLNFKSISQQKEQTSMIATSTEEMTAAVEQVNQNVVHTLSEVDRVCAEVKDGEVVLHGNISRINALASDINHGSEVIQRLSIETNNINSILDAISGVAEQTNLLALNAAIEAARAGEQGRGFAVVADEVRTLAARAQQSTAEIKEMIQRLQSSATEAVSSMSNSRESAQGSVTGINESGEKLSSIARMMDSIREMNTQIAAASEEQSAVTRDQLKRITAIADASEHTADAARESNAASNELARMAEKQRELVSRFKL